MAGRAVILLLAVVACSNATDYFNNRIIGGDVAPRGLAPFAVSLRTGLLIKSHFCGASLISPRHVVTAAHCVDAVWSSGIIGGGSLSSSLQVLSGTLTQSSGGVKSTVKRNFTHPAWDTKKIKNDIGIFELTNNLVFNDDTRPVPVLTDLYVGHGAKLTAVGWGLTKYPAISGSTVLKYLETHSLGHEECVKMMDAIASHNPGFPEISHGELCTFHSVGHAVCQGDSGSALFNTEGLVGVVSWGVPCATGAPDVFTRVSYYSDWIKGILSQ